jgi:hypothetical protein
MSLKNQKYHFLDSSDNNSFIKKNNKILDSSDSNSFIKKNNKMSKKLLDSSDSNSLILTESTINTSDIVLISDEI